MILTITKWKPNKSRPRRRLRQRWKDRVEDGLKMLGVTNGEELAEYIDAWREIVELAMDLNGLE
jgi:hypothetical protein